MFKFFIIFCVLSAVLIFTAGCFNIIKYKAAPNSQTATSTAGNSDKPVVSGKTLSLSNQKLDKVPNYILNSTTVEILDLSYNNLTGSIPAEIRFLKKLRELNLSNNSLTGLPAEIGQLSELEVLNVANNKLTGLPYELGNLKKLRILDLSGNDYSQADLDKIKTGLSGSVVIKQ